MSLPEEPKNPKSPPPLEEVERLRYDTQTLFGRAREVELIHRGEIYRLRMTRQDKLILTK